MLVDVASGSLRRLTRTERDLLEAMIDSMAPAEAQPLRAQIGSVAVSGGCPCGCGTIDLEVPGPPGSAEATPRPVVDGDVVGLDGTVLGGLVLFVADGRLSRLEVFSVVDDPLEMPPVERARLRSSS
jgi:hypothetical protein